jgi:hypothetical protein
VNRNQKVKLRQRDVPDEMVQIIGLNEYGFLRVRKDDNTEIILQPDGNRFDYLENLIVFSTN